MTYMPEEACQAIGTLLRKERGKKSNTKIEGWMVCAVLASIVYSFLTAIGYHCFNDRTRYDF